MSEAGRLPETDETAHKVVKRYFQFGRLTVNELLDYCAQNDIDPSVATFGGGQLVWERPETEAEYERRREFQRARDLRHEEWERAMYEKLRAKFDLVNRPEEQADR